jgi:hypothetical protein
MNILGFYLRKLEKEEQVKSKGSWRKEIKKKTKQKSMKLKTGNH